MNCVLAGGIVLQVREESSSCIVLKEQTGGGSGSEASLKSCYLLKTKIKEVEN